MPTFDMKCKLCDVMIEEVLPRNNDEIIIPCPSCGNPMVKLIGAPTFKFHFKEGYMPTIGEYCTSERDYENKLDKLRRKKHTE